MTEPVQHPNQAPMSRQAYADAHNFRTRVTPQGDLLDMIRDLRKRIERLEAQINTH